MSSTLRPTAGVSARKVHMWEYLKKIGALIFRQCTVHLRITRSQVAV